LSGLFRIGCGGLAVAVAAGCLSPPPSPTSARSTPGASINPPGDAGPTLSCSNAQRAAPWVVQLTPTERALLGTAASRGVAIVAYDCRTLTVLPGCIAEGSYATEGVTERRQVVHLVDQEELDLNVPRTGSGPGLSIGPGHGPGARLGLDLEVAASAYQTVSRTRVTQASLAGQCSGATHFVRRIQLGAFTLGQDAGAAGAMPLRLELWPLGESSPGSASPAGSGLEPSSEPDPTCPEGWVATESKCTRQVVEPHACSPANPAECAEECEKGSAASCANIGWGDRHGDLWRESNRQACKLGSPAGCVNLGVALAERGLVGPAAATVAEAFSRACQLGDAAGCLDLARVADRSPPLGSTFDANAQRERACNLGLTRACSEAASARARGADADRARAPAWWRRACEDEDADACGRWGAAYALGTGVTPDPALAARAFTRACSLGLGAACERIASRTLLGEGVQKSDELGRELLGQACTRGDRGACRVERGLASGSKPECTDDQDCVIAARPACSAPCPPCAADRAAWSRTALAVAESECREAERRSRDRPRPKCAPCEPLRAELPILRAACAAGWCVSL
jgi:uncharacterized protein